MEHFYIYYIQRGIANFATTLSANDLSFTSRTSGQNISVFNPFKSYCCTRESILETRFRNDLQLRYSDLNG